MSPPAIEDILKGSLVDVLKGCNVGTCALLDPFASAGKQIFLTSPRAMSEVQVTHLTSLILDINSWSFARKRCLPLPTALIQLDGSGGAVKIVIGMPCADWLIIGGHFRRGGLFDPVRNQVQTLLKELFPEIASPSPSSLWRSGEITKLRRLNGLCKE